MLIIVYLEELEELETVHITRTAAPMMAKGFLVDLKELVGPME